MRGLVTSITTWVQRQNFTNKLKEIWEYKQKESDWIKTKNLADGYKKVIEDISSKLINQSEIIKQLEQEIERLVAENKK